MSEKKAYLGHSAKCPYKLGVFFKKGSTVICTCANSEVIIFFSCGIKHTQWQSNAAVFPGSHPAFHCLQYEKLDKILHGTRLRL